MSSTEDAKERLDSYGGVALVEDTLRLRLSSDLSDFSSDENSFGITVGSLADDSKLVEWLDWQQEIVDNIDRLAEISSQTKPINAFTPDDANFMRELFKLDAEQYPDDALREIMPTVPQDNYDMFKEAYIKDIERLSPVLDRSDLVAIEFAAHNEASINRIETELKAAMGDSLLSVEKSITREDFDQGIPSNDYSIIMTAEGFNQFTDVTVKVQQAVERSTQGMEVSDTTPDDGHATYAYGARSENGALTP